jgi:hypothetical protein
MLNHPLSLTRVLNKTRRSLGMHSWYRHFRVKQSSTDRRIAIAAAVATLSELADQIQILADEVNISKSQYLKENSKEAWKDPQNVQRLNKTLNMCWQSVVSAVRALKANSVFEAGNAIGTAKEMLGKACELVDCANKSLSRIGNSLASAWSKISSFSEQPQQKSVPQPQPQQIQQPKPQPQQPQRSITPVAA